MFFRENEVIEELAVHPIEEGHHTRDTRFFGIGVVRLQLRGTQG